MTESGAAEQRMSGGLIASSIAIFALVLCLIGGLVVGVAVAFAGDPQASWAVRFAVVPMMAVAWAPLLMISVWQVAIPIVLIGGLGLAYARTRFDLDRRVMASRIGKAIVIGVLCYAVLIALTLLPRLL